MGYTTRVYIIIIIMMIIIYIYHRFYIVMQDLDQMRRSQDVFPVLPLLWSIVEGPIFEA